MRLCSLGWHGADKWPRHCRFGLPRPVSRCNSDDIRPDHPRRKASNVTLYHAVWDHFSDHIHRLVSLLWQQLTMSSHFRSSVFSRVIGGGVGVVAVLTLDSKASTSAKGSQVVRNAPQVHYTHFEMVFLSPMGPNVTRSKSKSWIIFSSGGCRVEGTRKILRAFWWQSNHF